MRFDFVADQHTKVKTFKSPGEFPKDFWQKLNIQVVYFGQW